MAEIIAAISALPADVNRFTYVGEYLRSSFVIINPAWVHVLLYVLAVAFAIAFILTAVGLAAKVKKGEFYLYRWSEGLVIPNAVVLYSIWITVFILMMLANLIWQIYTDDQNRPPTDRLALFGTMWFCFWQAGFSYTISTISYTLKVGNKINLNPAEGAAKWRERKSQRDYGVYLVWFVDTLAIVLPISHIVSTWTVFIQSNVHFDTAWQITSGVRHTLSSLAPSYDASTFNATTDLLPSLAPLTEMQTELNEWIRLSRWGYGLLAFYCFLSLTIWAPFFLILGAQLRHTLKASTKRQASGEGIASEASTMKVVPRRVQEQYRNLLWTTGAIFLKDFAYGGVALAVGVRPGYVLDPHYNIVATLLTAGVFAICGNIIAFLIAYKSVRALRKDHHPHARNFGGSKPTVSTLQFRRPGVTQQMELNTVVKFDYEAPTVTVEKEVFTVTDPITVRGDYDYKRRPE